MTNPIYGPDADLIGEYQRILRGKLTADKVRLAGSPASRHASGYADALRIAGDIAQSADTTLGKGQQLAGDHNVYPVGRAEAVRAHAAQFAPDAQARLTVARVAAEHGRRQLADAAMPTVKGDPMIARTDARMVLDRAPASQRAMLAEQLARRSDDVGALVASPWLADYLAGLPDADLQPILKGVRSQALAAARDSGDPRRQAAADLHTNGELDAILDLVGIVVRAVNDELGRLAALAAVDPRDATIAKQRDQIARQRSALRS